MSMMRNDGKKLFQNVLFRKLFYSYLVIITLCALIYSAFLIYENHTFTERRMEAHTLQTADEIESVIRSRILAARNIVTDITYSTTLKSIYLSRISGSALDAKLGNDIKAELAQFMIRDGRNISGTMIFLPGETRVYSGSGMLYLGSKPFTYLDEEMPYCCFGTVQQTLRLEETSRYSFNKDYLIYLDNFTYQNGSRVGTICILFDTKAIIRDLSRVMGKNNGISVLLRGETELEIGEKQGIRYAKDSEAISGLSIILWANRAANSEDNIFVYFITLLIVLTALVFIAIAYRFSKSHYQIIGNIEELVSADRPEKMSQATHASAEEAKASILNNIKQLMVENKVYREDMITIVPYAKAAVLHDVLLGSSDSRNIQILREEKYLNLIRPYFIVSIFSLHSSAEDSITITSERIRELMEEICKSFSSSKLTLAYYYQNIQNIYLIANQDDDEIPDNLFFEIFSFFKTRLGTTCEITVGIDTIRDDIYDLQEACSCAVKALDNIISEGRDSIYYYEETDQVTEYYLPKEFIVELSRCVKKGKTERLEMLMQTLYEENEKRRLNSITARALIDEIYLYVTEASKDISGGNTLHLRIEKYMEYGTLLEIIGFYKEALLSLMTSLQEQKSEDEPAQARDRAIIGYINAHYLDPNLSLQYLSDQYGVSFNYIGQLCRRELNTTFLKFIQLKRIEHAMGLMKEGRYSIAQISSLCGYTNQLTFRRNFKIVTGVNPSEHQEYSR